jgi:alanine racemase
MLVGGRRCPIVGRISMDLTTLDVTDVPGCAVGDEVVVLGAQGAQQLSAVDLADACGTIAYEVLTNISPRVPRVYRS